MAIKRTAFAVAAALFFAPSIPASADQTGMADMHSQYRVGGKRCFVDHTHSGSSSGARSRAAAQSAAIRSWREFTAFEYGTDWANWGKAIAKRVSCSGAGRDWGCSLEARPCR